MAIIASRSLTVENIGRLATFAFALDSMNASSLFEGRGSYMTITVSERKAKEVARLRSAAVRAIDQLKRYAIDEGGRFAVFGSFARGDVIHSSDFDLMVDFPSLTERKAALRAETICREAGLKPDVHLASESSAALMARVARDAVFLP